MMAMLIRAGLPSRKAAIAAIKTTEPAFFDSAGLREWLVSEGVEAQTALDDWPTPETAALWRRFRSEITGASAPTWKARTYRRRLRLRQGQQRPPNGVYRVELDPDANQAWVVSPDFRRIAPLRRTVRDSELALYRARFVDDDESAHIERIGPGSPSWDVEL